MIAYAICLLIILAISKGANAASLGQASLLVDNYDLVDSSSVQPYSSSMIQAPNKRKRLRRLGGFRPEDDSHVDCAMLSSFLQSMYPQCEDEEDDDMDYSDERPDDRGVRKSLVPYTLTVGIKNRILTAEATRYIRYAVTKAMSKALTDNSPFYVPKAKKNNGGSGSGGNGDSSEDGDGRRFLEIDEEDEFRFLTEGMVTWDDGRDIEDDVSISGYGGGGGNKDDEGGNGGNDGNKNNGVSPSKIWLWRFFTSAEGPIIVPANKGEEDVMLYTLKLEFVAWWRRKNHAVDKRRHIRQIREATMEVGHQVIRNGELREIFERVVQGNLDRRPNKYRDTSWLLEEGNFVFLDPTEEGIPTYLYPLEKGWGTREWAGALLLFLTLVVSGALHYFSVSKTDQPLHQGTNQHLLTEDGVRDLLTVGWRYEKQKDGSQLFLQVFDKSNMGYTDNDSVLMGGVEQMTVSDDQAAPAALTESTVPTERETATNTDTTDTITNRMSGQAGTTITTSDADTNRMSGEAATTSTISESVTNRMSGEAATTSTTTSASRQRLSASNNSNTSTSGEERTSKKKKKRRRRKKKIRE